MPFMHGPGGAERLQQLQPILNRCKAAAEHNRALILGSPEASKQLCRELQIRDARQWNGYVPAPPPPANVDKNLKDIGDIRERLEQLVKHTEAGLC